MKRRIEREREEMKEKKNRKCNWWWISMRKDLTLGNEDIRWQAFLIFFSHFRSQSIFLLINVSSIARWKKKKNVPDKFCFHSERKKFSFIFLLSFQQANQPESTSIINKKENLIIRIHTWPLRDQENAKNIWFFRRIWYQWTVQKKCLRWWKTLKKIKMIILLGLIRALAKDFTIVVRISHFRKLLNP